MVIPRNGVFMWEQVTGKGSERIGRVSLKLMAYTFDFITEEFCFTSTKYMCKKCFCMYITVNYTNKTLINAWCVFCKIYRKRRVGYLRWVSPTTLQRMFIRLISVRCNVFGETHLKQLYFKP